MNRRLLPILLGFLTVAAALPAAAETERYLVASRDRGAARAERLRVASNSLSAVRHRVRNYANVNAFGADLTPAEAADLQRGFIVEPIVERHALGLGAIDANGEVVEPPPPQTTPWGISAIRAQSVWPVTRGAGVNVVVADTGIDAEHPDLRHAYAGGYNTFDPSLPPVDLHRHGTHVAGTIVAADNEFGVIGVAPDVRLWAVKVLDENAGGTNESVVAGFNWVMQKAKEEGGRWVMNLSLGSTLPSEIEELAVTEAITQGIVVVASAGNRGTDSLKYPAKYRGVIAVAAVDEDRKRALFSSFGLGVTIMAPGAEVQSTIIQGVHESADAKTAAGSVLPGWKILGSPYRAVQGKIIDCGTGLPEEIPANVRGNIALIRRGKLLFREMAKAAKDAGASALVIQTYANDTTPTGAWTFYPSNPDPVWDTFEFPLAIGVRFDVGEQLLQQESVTVAYRSARYGAMNGTSMAAPHVSGTAALLLALDPTLSIAQIDWAIRHTAVDINTPGWDYDTSWGVIDALAAAHYVAPGRFNVPPPPPFQSGRRRSSR